MTDDLRAAYLAGESDGAGLNDDERAAIDRMRAHLADEAIWVSPPADGQFRLLAAATAEAGGLAVPSDEAGGLAVPTDEEAADAGAPTDEEAPADGGDVPPTLFDPQQPRTTIVNAGQTDEPVDELAARRASRETAGSQPATTRGRRAAWFGAGALAAAAVAAIGFVAVDRLNPVDDEPAEEVAILVEHQLTATELDPDATGRVEVKPTVAGVEFVLWLKGLDNTEGTAYYGAWLMGEGEAIPLGTFHWRAGGVPIVLWSGVDDPAYDELVITRQERGDGGTRSDEVVMRTSVPDLIAD